MDWMISTIINANRAYAAYAQDQMNVLGEEHAEFDVWVQINKDCTKLADDMERLQAAISDGII